jgi:hypothetical protein
MIFSEYASQGRLELLGSGSGVFAVETEIFMKYVG